MNELFRNVVVDGSGGSVENDGEGSVALQSPVEHGAVRS